MNTKAYGTRTTRYLDKMDSYEAGVAGLERISRGEP